MRNFLVCAGIGGRAAVIEQLEAIVRERKPDTVLFAGGLFARERQSESPGSYAEGRHHDMELLEQFFGTLGATRTNVAVIPGPHDVPLRAFLMAGMHARSQSPGVHLVHCTILSARDVVISGVGGELTEIEDCGEPLIRCSRTTRSCWRSPAPARSRSAREPPRSTATCCSVRPSDKGSRSAISSARSPARTP